MNTIGNAPIDNAAREGLDQRIDDVESQLKAGTLDFQFATDGTKYGYLDDNGDFVPFKNPVGTKSITSNGTHDVTDYASASVNVPNSNSGTYTPTANGAALDMGETNSYRYVNTNAVYALGQDNPNINIIVNNVVPLIGANRIINLPKPNTYYLVMYNTVTAQKVGIASITEAFAKIGSEPFQIRLVKTDNSNTHYITTNYSNNGYATAIEISSTT